MRRVVNLWRSHGTRIMGVVVAILGALTAFGDRFQQLWWSERGDLIFQLIVDVASYLLIGAGAVIWRRGYTNARRASDLPVIPGEEPSVQP